MMENRQIRILQLIDSIGETSAPYNEHCLPVATERNISICTYFAPAIIPPKTISIFPGDNTLPGFFRALNAARKSRNFDVIHAHSVYVAVFFILAKFFYRWKFTKNTVFTLHSSYPNYKFKHKLLLLVSVIFFRRIICCSNTSLNSLPVYIRFFARNKLQAIQNGLDLSRVDRIEKGHSKQRYDSLFTIISVGRLIEVKNPLVILKSFELSADASTRLIFVGEGNLREILHKEIIQCKFEEQVSLTGLVQREKVYEYLLNADLFISSSFIEGLPVAVLEAMACGCPALLSDIESHREIAAGVDFIPLIPPTDIKKFGDEIIRFRRMSPAERAEIGRKCRKLVEDRFSLTRMHKEYHKVYTELI